MIMRAAIITLLLLSLATLGSALAASNSVPRTTVGSALHAITANALKPAACSHINITNIIIGSGAINGTTGNDLILGSPQDDDIKGRGGWDCIISGAGNDRLQGNGGQDVCIGGPGNNQYIQCNVIQ
jgi:Ca2+-binding RTX toxin-like protein